MMRTPGLSRLLVLSMSAVVLGVTLAILVGSYVFYALLMEFVAAPDPASGSWLPPTGPEWLWMASITLAGLLVAVFAAARLARRILAPLVSVMRGVRQVAQGDLGARAGLQGANPPGEIARLVDDFNAMAERLQRTAAEMATWNAAIAHELRTPVTILRGRLQGLAEGVFAPDEAQFRSLLAQVEGLSRLIEDLRVLGLADSGHLQLRPARADLALAIRDVVRLLEPELRAAGFVPVLELATEAVRCDAARVRQVVLALLDNARRHGEPGEIRVQTRVADGVFSLQVENHGPAIPHELAAHVFEPFRRGGDARSQQGGGSGLGLAVVEAIAKAHGGQARCSRGPAGNTTVFEVCFPSPGG